MPDARRIRGAEFAAAHIPGSLSNELRPAFATWLGWLVSPDRPLIVVAGSGQDRGELVEAALPGAASTISSRVFSPGEWPGFFGPRPRFIMKALPVTRTFTCGYSGSLTHRQPRDSSRTGRTMLATDGSLSWATTRSS